MNLAQLQPATRTNRHLATCAPQIVVDFLPNSCMAAQRASYQPVVSAFCNGMQLAHADHSGTTSALEIRTFP
jgi:hypothetical protein